MSFIVAIDGPSAAGKGTLARAISTEYGFRHLDTGMLYRVTAALAIDRGIEPDLAVREITLEDFSHPDLRSPKISQEASRISAIPAVRAALLTHQQEFARSGFGVVLDGRDIGTVIAPEAEVKLFVTASPEARAKRRHLELELTGATATYTEVLSEMKIRDERDSSRSASPLRVAHDATVIDTTDITHEEATEMVFRLVDRALMRKSAA